jgi:parallel beta-helix repeat protein
LVAPTSGEYQFFATADDGVRLSVNGAQVLNDWSDHPARESRGSVSLVQGERVPIALEYYENRGRAKLRLEWSGPGVGRQVVPAGQLFPVGSVAPTTLTPTTQPATTEGTFYVATNGRDENPGTQQLPWRTIQKAAATLTAGQTVLVGSGAYDDGVLIERSGAPGRMITYKAAAGATPKIRITKPNDYGVILKGASYIRVEGFEVAYEGPDPSSNKAYEFNAGMDATVSDGGVQSHHVEFVGNNVHDFPGQGIGSLQADYMLIEGNTIWNNSKWNPYQTSGISMYQTANVDFAPGFHNIIRGNVVYSNENKVGNLDPTPIITDGNCIIIDDQRRQQKILENKTPQGPYESDTLVENNICAGNGGRGVHVFNSDNVLVRNNTLVYNLRTSSLGGGELNASWFSGGPGADQAPNRRGNVRFVNNLVVSDRLGAEQATNDPRDRNNVVFQRNFYFGTKPALADGGSVLNSSAPDDIIGTSDPLVNPADGDFRLRPGSAPIDTARPDGSPTFDQIGSPRPFGAAPDIGALEWRP